MIYCERTYARDGKKMIFFDELFYEKNRVLDQKYGKNVKVRVRSDATKIKRTFGSGKVAKNVKVRVRKGGFLE